MAKADDPPHKARIAAVDDHPIVVEGLASLLTSAADHLQVRNLSSGCGIEWLGASRTFTELKMRMSRWPAPPDIVLFDLHLHDGFDAADGIAELTKAGISVVVLTSELRPVPIRRAMRAGAAGLILKSDDVQKILDVIRSVCRGNFAVSGDLAFVLATDDDLAPHLAPRELEVLRLLAEGVPRKAVGNRLDPPVKLATVVTYLNRICQRYQEWGRDVTTSNDAVRAAMADGHLDLPGAS